MLVRFGDRAFIEHKEVKKLTLKQEEGHACVKVFFKAPELLPLMEDFDKREDALEFMEDFAHDVNKCYEDELNAL
jgi:hypothetical protein